MAWITKNSAGATVEKRAEPYLTDAMRKHLKDEILPRYETTLGALLPTLHEIQHTYGWIPHQAMLEVAAECDERSKRRAKDFSFRKWQNWLEEGLQQASQALCHRFLCERGATLFI